MKRDVLRRGIDPNVAKHMPVLPSAQSAADIAGATGLRRDLRDTFGFIKTQVGQAKQQGLLQKLAITRQGQAGLQSLYGSAAERGMLGSSVTNIQKALAQKDTQSQLLENRNAVVQAQMQAAAQGQQAVRDYRTGVMNLAMAQAASKSDQAVQNLINAAVNATTRGGGGGGGGAGGGNNNGGSNKLTFAQRIEGMSPEELEVLRSRLAERIGNRIDRVEDKGYTVVKRNGRFYKQYTSPTGQQTGLTALQGLNKLSKRRRKVTRALGVPGAPYSQ